MKMSMRMNASLSLIANPGESVSVNMIVNVSISLCVNSISRN